MRFKNTQVTDQTLKGAIVGAIAYFLAKWNIDPAAQAALMPVIISLLAYASTKVGDPKVASFLEKAAEEAPVVVEEVTTATKKAAARKSSAKPKD